MVDLDNDIIDYFCYDYIINDEKYFEHFYNCKNCNCSFKINDMKIRAYNRKISFIWEPSNKYKINLKCNIDNFVDYVDFIACFISAFYNHLSYDEFEEFGIYDEDISKSFEGNEYYR